MQQNRPSLQHVSRHLLRVSVREDTPLEQGKHARDHASSSCGRYKLRKIRLHTSMSLGGQGQEPIPLRVQPRPTCLSRHLAADDAGDEQTVQRLLDDQGTAHHVDPLVAAGGHGCFDQDLPARGTS